VLYHEPHFARADHFYWLCRKKRGKDDDDSGVAAPAPAVGACCGWKGPVYYQSCRRCGRVRGAGDAAVDYEGVVVGTYEGLRKVRYEGPPDERVMSRYVYRALPEGEDDQGD
jgi:hypothetical protein